MIDVRSIANPDFIFIWNILKPNQNITKDTNENQREKHYVITYCQFFQTFGMSL